MAEPTKGQKQWLFEQCGCYQKDGLWYFPDGTLIGEKLPSIDIWALPYLFKCAVPKLRYANMQYSNQYSDVISPYSATASIQFADNHTWADEDPALALFWAIYKALRGKDGD